MELKGTTICAVKRNGITAIAGDGQVTMGQSIVMKGNAKKVKRIYNDKTYLIILDFLEIMSSVPFSDLVIISFNSFGFKVELKIFFST